MTLYHAKSTDFFVDEYDFSAVASAANINKSRPLAPCTAFADTDDTFVPGKIGFEIPISGYFSTSSPAYDGEMFADLTAVDRRVGIYPQGYTAGVTGYECTANPKSQARASGTSDLISLDCVWRGDGDLMRSWSLYQDAAVASSANGTGYEVGASSASQTVVGIIRLLAAPGGAGDNTCDVKIQSDVDGDFSTPTDQLTFTQLNQASTATFEVVTAAGAVTDTYWRVVVTIAGAGTRTFNLFVSFGIINTA